MDFWLNLQFVWKTWVRFISRKMSEFKDLNRRRGSIKARLTNFKKYLEDLVDGKLDNKLDKIDLLELESRMSKVENILSEFDEIQRDIETIVNDEDFETQISQRLEFENSFHKVMAVCKKVLADNVDIDQKVDMSDVVTVRSIASNGSGRGREINYVPNNSVVAPQARPKLPSIPVPKFNGNSANWLEFRDTFLSLIHNNDSIADIEKFYFLKGALEGEANKAIQLVDVSASNYVLAWDSLCKTYDDKEMLVDEHIKSLLNLPSTVKESPFELRQLLDILTKNLHGLKKLGIDVSSWDPILIYIFSDKLDKKTKLCWEESKGKGSLPTIKQFQDFLMDRIGILGRVEKGNGKKLDMNYDNKNKQKTQKSFVSTSPMCSFCKNNHYINNCPDFLKFNIRSRFEQAKKLGLCLNCLKKGNHFSKNCESSGCRKCGAKHHTLLHYEKKSIDSSSEQSTQQVNTGNDKKQEQATPGSSGQIASVQVTSVFVEKGLVVQSEVLLSTALIQIVDSHGYPHTCRALLDNGSQSNLITEGLCERLGLKQENVNISITGINQVVSSITHKCLVNVQSLHNNFERVISCLVMPQICDSVPSQKLNISHLDIPSHLKLADPEFDKPGRIDLLLGAEIFYSLLCIGQVNLGKDQLVLQKTRLGWIMTGSFGILSKQSSLVKCNFSMNVDVQTQLAKFWAVEEPPLLGQILSQEDKDCEEIFEKTTKRDANGQFVVNIPLLDSPSRLGDSREYALHRFLALEKRFLRNPRLKEMYVKFMEEYKLMGHMSLVTSPKHVSYFLPHHGVVNESSSTTKLRVVFNGSAKTDSGVSFNDLQYTGPNLQDELVSILLRFRQHNVVLCADVEKMYRMVLVEPSQRSLQKVLWRSNDDEDIQEYELNTVTYGTKSAPYLAIRCLKQLGLESLESHPRAAQIILKDFYVDDMLSGAGTREEAIELGNEISTILKSGCMHLRKWISNDSEVVKQINGINNTSDTVHFGEKDQNKTLGIYWLFHKDVLMYSINFSSAKVNTKRSILSDISRIYDPLGLVGPCVIIAKVLLQKLWTESLAWDETLPMELDSQWIKLRNQFYCLNNLTIPRHVVCLQPVRVDIHGFADASIEAYGACVYSRSVSVDGYVKVSLVFSKVKVAPLKALTVPRLELCGALLLAKLVTKVKQSMDITFQNTYLWCDSTVVLGWINSQPSLLQTFVRNRIGQIQELTHTVDWHHVKSADNPADILSRGLAPNKIIDCQKWWQGPEWLVLDETCWPVSNCPVIENLPEVDTPVKTVQLVISIDIFPFEKFSCLNRLKRGVAYCFRFIRLFKPGEIQFKGVLRACEVDHAMKALIKISQRESFSQEIQNLEGKNPRVAKGIANLNPFIDENGFLRVGGRLQLSYLDYAKKHPILLSAKHRFTLLLFEAEHKRLLHAGPQMLLSSIREHYWVIGGRNLARKVAHRCVKCLRANPKPLTQIMGTLPKPRVCPQPPFYTTGLDYAGPFSIRERYGRGAKFSKCYLCIFVCFTTKAVHLEVVSDLTTEAFIATFRRFVSRRGKPLTIYSDNGSNLVGANTELKNLGQFMKNQSGSLSEHAANVGVSWKFIPANSPNFGGLWESGVKSCKFHLKRVMANAALTFEGFCTLLTQVEAVLNSRPLVPLSSNPNDMDVLTPAHFLIGRRLTALPDPDVKEIPLNRLSRFQHIQMLVQHFWSRWTKEYITELQCRNKWTSEKENIKIGQLVLIKDDNLPPLAWKLGRVTELFPGPDHKVRVVKIKTQCGEIKRAISKLCPLPSDK